MWCYSRPRYMLRCQISSRSVYSVALCWQKPQFLPFFGLQHLVVSPTGSSLTKLNTDVQTFPLSNGIRIVSVLQRLHGAIGRTISDVQKRDEQTDKQTDKKTQRFWPSRRRVKSEPCQCWHGDRGPRARSCASKTFGV